MATAASGGGARVCCICAECCQRAQTQNAARLGVRYDICKQSQGSE